MRKLLSKIKMIKKKIKYIIYTIECKIIKQNQYILLGTPLHGNLGDHAIVVAEKKFLKDSGIKIFEVATDEKDYCYQFIKKRIPDTATILITGGGNIGSEWLKEERFIRKIVEDFKEYKIIIFPQTIFYKDTEEGLKEKEEDIKAYKKATNLILCVRENKSYEIAKNLHKNTRVLLLPDIVLYLDNESKKNAKSDNILLCLRKDVEGKLTKEDHRYIENVTEKYGSTINYTDTVVKNYIKQNKRERMIKLKLKEFKNSKLVITDRLHGMVFAKITNTPCIVIGNYSHKVKGVYEWIKDCNFILYIEDIKDIECNIEKVLEDDSIKNIALKERYNNLKQILTESSDKHE